MPIHIKAKIGEVAPYVLLPGDPNRSRFIAENFFENPKLYTDYRQMLGFTGTYKNIPVSVQTTGMGCPSISIILEELVMLETQVWIRIGTCGGLNPDLNLGSTILASAAFGCESVVAKITNSTHYHPVSDTELLRLCMDTAETLDQPSPTVGPIITKDLFYGDHQQEDATLTGLGCLAAEMETAALFSIAAKYNKKATTLLTVSDLICGGPPYPRAPEAEILKSSQQTIKLALESIVAYHNQTTA